jgi:hypothetical protein
MERVYFPLHPLARACGARFKSIVKNARGAFFTIDTTLWRGKAAHRPDKKRRKCRNTEHQRINKGNGERHG